MKSFTLSLVLFLINVVDRCLAQDYYDPSRDSCPHMNPFRFSCNPNAKFSSFDGSCNNLKRPWQGQFNTEFKRYFQAQYSDGAFRPKQFGASGRPLTNPRIISRALSSDNLLVNPIYTHILPIFGQFVAHDLTSLATSTDSLGNQIDCPCNSNNPLCLSVNIPSNDQILRMSCMKFTRSGTVNNALNCNFRRAEQINLVTHYLDASNIYGSSVQTSNSTRAFFRGQMRTSQGVTTGRVYLPTQNGQFFAGEGRANENMALTSVHTLFLREHNAIADRLAQINPQWNDDRLFLETRRIIQGIYSNIVYREFVPAVIGRSFAQMIGITPQPVGQYFSGYDSNINATIANEFAAAAYRFGHSLIRGQMNRFDRFGQRTGTPVDVSRTVFNSAEAFNAPQGGLDSILLGLVNEPAAEIDPNVANFLQNRLFEFMLPDGSLQAVDLAATNINRGRDHGLPSYTRVRERCGLRRVTSFDQLGDVMSPDRINQLRTVYENVDDIDLFVGGLSESRAPDSAVGLTIACLVGNQFRDLKFGDRYFYENAPRVSPGAFSIGQLDEIRRMTLAHLVCNNFNVNNVQPNVFTIPNQQK